MNELNKTDIEKRLAYFEQQNVYMHQALKTARELSDFQASINQLESPFPILEKTKEQALQFIDFKGLSFFLVDEATADFYLVGCWPESLQADIEREVNVFIDDDTFSRAVFEKKPITAYACDGKTQYLLCVMTTISRVRGMFVGILNRHSKYLKETSLELFSILMVHCANALESFELYHQIRRSNQALAESESSYRLLAETANELIFKISPQGTVEYANRSAIKTSGYSKESMLNQPLFDIIENLDQIMDICARYPSKIYNTRLITRFDNAIPLELNVTPIQKKEQGLTSFLLVARDISERVTFEKEKINLKSELWQSQKMEALGALAGGIAHDFNNILSGIFGYSQLARSNINDTDKALRNIDQVMVGAQKATDLVQQILAFTRKSAQENQPLKISLVIKEALKLLRASIPSTIQIKETITSGSRVVADPIKIHQLIMNLCTNAYHAMMDDGGVMTVKLEDTTEKDQVILEVQDTGHGMPPNVLEKVFEPYFTTKETGKGTGLGLSVVQGIVREYKGTISIRSAPDQGTTFSVSLPVAELETGTAASLIADKQPPPPGTETIMIVDDESALLDSMQNYLEDFGYRVYTYADPVTALSVFKKDPEKIDLVITDMTMPGMTGDRLAVEILRHRPDTPVFLCTGYSETVSGSKARELGIREYIQKPMILSDLAVLIRNALD